jgi:hypothetical protein
VWGTGTGYATASASVQPGITNPLWNQEILVGCKRLADLGVPSVCFNQNLSVNAPPPNINSLTTQIRAYANFNVDPAAWLQSASGNYRMLATSEDGNLVTEQTLRCKWKGSTGAMTPGELRVFEFIAE